MYQPIWKHVKTQVENGIFAVNDEIYQELCHLPGHIGTCLNNNKDKLVLEVGENNWNWQRYLKIVEEMRIKYKGVISEYNSNRKGTVGLNDVSIVALAKCMRLPLISMEAKAFRLALLRFAFPASANLKG